MLEQMSKGQKVALGLVILAAVAVGVDAFREHRDAPVGSGEIGHLFPAEQLAKIDRLSIAKKDFKAEITRTEKSWVISSAAGAPANSQRIVDLLDRVQRVPMEFRELIADDSSKAVYGMGTDAQATTLEVSAGGKVVTSVVLGKNAPSGGTFVLDTTNKKLWLSKEALSVPTQLSDWEYRVLVKVKPEALREIHFVPPQKRKGDRDFTVSRQKSEEALALVPSGKPTGAIKDDLIKSMTSILNHVTYDQRVPITPDFQRTLEDSGSATVKTFGGMTYTVRIWTTPDVKGQQKRYFLDMQRGGELASDSKEVEYEMPDLNSVRSTTLFETNASQAMTFIKGKEDLLNKATTSTSSKRKPM